MGTGCYAGIYTYNRQLHFRKIKLQVVINKQCSKESNQHIFEKKSLTKGLAFETKH